MGSNRRAAPVFASLWRIRRCIITSALQNKVQALNEIHASGLAIRLRLLQMLGPKASLMRREVHPSLEMLFGEPIPWSNFTVSPAEALLIEERLAKVLNEKLYTILYSEKDGDVSTMVSHAESVIKYDNFYINELYGWVLISNHPLDYHRWNRSEHNLARRDLPILRVVSKPKLSAMCWTRIPYSKNHNIMRNPVTVAQYERFVNDGGYECERYWQPEHWLWVQSTGRKSPRSWKLNGTWEINFLLRVIPTTSVPDYPVTGISLAEAFAFAAYTEESLTGKIQGKVTLPSAEQWLAAASEDDSPPASPPLEENGRIEIREPEIGVNKFFGNCWEWTCSRSISGHEFGDGGVDKEYVLLGGSVLTPRSLLSGESRMSQLPTCDETISGFRLVCTDDIVKRK